MLHAAMEAGQLQCTLTTYRKRLYTELLGRLALQMPGVPPVGAGCINTPMYHS